MMNRSGVEESLNGIIGFVRGGYGEGICSPYRESLQIIAKNAEIALDEYVKRDTAMIMALREISRGRWECGETSCADVADRALKAIGDDIMEWGR